MIRTPRCATLGLVLFTAILTVTGCSSMSKTSGPTVTWTAPFNGQDLYGWQCTGPADQNAWLVASKVTLDPADPTKFAITPGSPGVLVNGPVGKTCNLFTTEEFGDCEAHIEFMVPGGSNSGVYFMGRYEIQVLDSYGKENVEFSDAGGIYARWINEQNVEGHAPRVNASRPPGEWQTFDVIFRAPRLDADGRIAEKPKFVRVIHNGVVVHENVELNGPTRASMLEKPATRGPLMLQGDHGPVAYRNIRLRPME